VSTHNRSGFYCGEAGGNRPPCAFTLVELIVVLAIVGTLIGLIVPAVIRARESANRLRCADNLRQLALALHAYHGVERQFPPGSSYRGGADPYPFMSWLTRLLPFVEQSPLFRASELAYKQDKDFRVNPPHVGFSTTIQLYNCPSDPLTGQIAHVGGLEVAFTDYLGNEGLDLRLPNGVLFMDSRIRLTDIIDGTSQTLLIGERPPSPDGLLGWWYAGWGQVKTGSAEVVLGMREKNLHYSGCKLGPYEYGPGSKNNRCDAFHFWSFHAGQGSNFAFADGSVHFIPYSAKAVMPALATRDGGEAVEFQ
jgi:prepilin-type N-terminal cleavage/methylation domain-containing protein/prepilin-type processing-associated H-X9-DG protein